LVIFAVTQNSFLFRGEAQVVAQRSRITNDWEQERKKIKILSLVFLVIILVAAAIIAIYVLRSTPTTPSEIDNAGSTQNMTLPPLARAAASLSAHPRAS